MPSQLLKSPSEMADFIKLGNFNMNYRYVGILKEDIAYYWETPEHKNKPILVFDDRKQHVIENHLKDFGTEEEIERIYQNLNNIIKKPDYVFYNSKTKGLEYYKKINSDVCVAVRVNSGKVLKIKS